MGQFWRNGGVGLLVFCTGLSALAYAGHTLPTLLCWWCRDQGNSFSGRMWCECTPAVAFGVALLGQQLGRRGRAAVVVLSLMCVLWTVALLRAYVHGWVPAEQPQSLEFTYRECVEAVLHP